MGTTRHVAPVDLPIWAQGGSDKRAALPWDTSQTIANCKVNGNAALAKIDVGIYIVFHVFMFFTFYLAATSATPYVMFTFMFMFVIFTLYYYITL